MIAFLSGVVLTALVCYIIFLFWNDDEFGGGSPA